MSPCRISKLEIQGFRSFGRDVQTLEFLSPLAAVWGPNSQGKTSLAEAVEFLLTGQIVRRSLMASGQDEFADALRNAHLPKDALCFVQATITDGDGTAHTIKRTLKTDYGKKQDCETKLEIDGAAVSEIALAGIGIVLSQPPLRAPVLAQHTLGYLFSAKPQDRAGYFKALLEVTDLDEFRSAVAALEKECEVVPGPLIVKLEAAIEVAGKHMRPLLAKVPGAAAIDEAFAAACKDLIEAFGETAPSVHAARIDKVEAILGQKRAKTFPIKGFDRKAPPPWSEASDQQHEKLTHYLTERAKVDEETRRLTNLFSEALALPAVADAGGSIDCPLCGAEDGLTPKRVAFIRARVADTKAFKVAEKEFREILSQMVLSLEALTNGVTGALPAFITSPSRSRRAQNFRVEKIREMLGDERGPAIDAWLAALRRLMRGRAALCVPVSRLAALIVPCAVSPEALTDPVAIRSGFFLQP
jgi:AAA domain